jgi:alpha-tubulin suppressor-like RCC1 family protein
VDVALESVPALVQCIQITVTPSAGPATSQTFPVTAGASTAAPVPLGTLPVGTDTISGQAYTVACASIASAQPAWTAAAQTVQVQPGVVGAVTLTFLLDHAVTATPNFVGNLTQVSVGYLSSYIAAIFSNGSVEALGGDPALQFSTTAFAPVSFVGVSGVTSIVSDGSNDCILTTGGQVECVGSDPGNGTTSSTAFVTALSGGVTQLSAGMTHECALSNGSALCWGTNSYGQVGNGTSNAALSPLFGLNGGANYAVVTSLAAGGNHTCAVQGGNVYCWGSNALAQVGVGNTSTLYYYSPTLAGPLGISPPPTPPVPLIEQVQVVAGYEHTCSLRADGAVFCWGLNGSGQVGNGTTTNPVLLPVSVAAPTGFPSVAQLAASYKSTCARGNDSGKTVWCWGDCSLGECGVANGSTTVATPQRVPNLPPSAALFSSGSGNTFCSLGTDQSLECWGGIPVGNEVKYVFTPTVMTL